jgi:hypothetical protein
MHRRSSGRTDPPEPHGFMANLDSELDQQVSHISQARRIPEVHHDHQPDHFSRRGETAEQVGGLVHFTVLSGPAPPAILVRQDHAQKKRPEVSPRPLDQVAFDFA